MSSALRKFVHWLFGGDPDLLPIDRRFFLLLTSFSVVISLAGMVANVATGMNSSATLLTALAPLLLITFHFVIRSTENYRIYFFPITLLMLALLAGAWFTNAGIDGNVLLLIYVTFVALFVAAKQGQRRILYYVFILFSTALILFHFFLPQSVATYTDPSQRFVDLVFGNLLYFSFLAVLLQIIITSYRSQAGKLIEAAEYLRESEEKYRLLVEESSDPVFSYTRDGRYRHVNRAFALAVGKDVSQIAGKSIGEVFDAPDAELRYSALERLFTTKEPITVELHAPQTDRYFQTTFTPLFDDNGEVTIAICVSKDITERRKTEEALRTSLKRLELFFNQSIYGYYCSMFDKPFEWNESTNKEKILFDIDDHQYITEINDEMLRQYNARRENLIGRPMSSFFKHDRESGRRFRRELFDKGKLHVETFELKDDQTPVWIEGDYICIYDDLGRIAGTLGVQVDISERKRAEKEKEILHSELLQTRKMESIGRLAGGVAHDFNNLMQAILGQVELIRKNSGDEKILVDGISIIESYAHRSTDLTRQLLAFAQKQTIAPMVLDLNDSIEKFLRDLRMILGEKIDLAWSPGANLWKVKVDPNQIRQILTSLCLNARDAIEGSGNVTIKTETICLDFDHPARQQLGEIETPEFVVLSVTDNGRGMSNEVLEHLFEPFYTTKDFGKGTGLGLATVYGIVQQNKGFIRVESEPARGTTFQLGFPHHSTDYTPPVESNDPLLVAGGTETILLVEDEPALLQLSEMILQAQGYEVLAARDGIEAMELAGAYQGEIDLLVTDVIMPEMNGWELSRLVKKRYPGSAAIFMSGYSAEVINQNGILQEGIHFIEKPFPMQNLCLMVRKVLDIPR